MWKYSSDTRKNAEQQERQVKESAKLERPNSLSIQQSEDLEDEHNVAATNNGVAVDVVKSEVKAAELGKAEEINRNEVDNTMNDEVDVTSAKLSDLNVDQNSKKTPSHLTEQGFFDLKFYHNKLW